MKKLIFTVICFILGFTSLKAQTGVIDEPITSTTGWTAGTGYTLSEGTSGTELEVVCSSVGTTYQIFQYKFTSQNISANPYVQISVRNPNSSSVKLRIDLQDVNGYVTNTSPVSYILAANSSYSTYNFDFTGRFTQTYPNTQTVNSASIVSVNIYINPGGSTGFSGTVYFDSLRVGSDAIIPPPPAGIKLNQVGFYPTQNKIAIAAELTAADSFYVVSSTQTDTLFRGLLGTAAKWVYSGETAQVADFTAFDSVGGTFYITADSLYSFPFTIAAEVHNAVAKGLLKSYYYNRASEAIVSPWGESWTRAEGHADKTVYIDTTASTTDRPTGTVISSPKGWYDAGDYNKYVVNAGITTYTILALYEHFPSYFDTLNTNIPESSNNIPDILDEALWEIRWLLTAQDTNSGGVYHKITDPSFDALTDLPSQDNQKRYAVYMGTAATLDFAAVMAQAYRIFSDSGTSQLAQNLPGLADSCLKAAIKAYNWAKLNPNVTVTGNPSNISTGTYADGTLTDEHAWARMELYAALRQDSLYQHADIASPSPGFWIPGWQTVNTLGLVTLVNYRYRLNTAGYADTATMKSQLLTLAGYYLSTYNSSAYKVAMGQSSGDFDWGSNANVGNQGLVLLQAYRLTGNNEYLNAALSNLDYVLGRNGTFYSFITGFGSKPPTSPQHRTSDALMNLHPGLAPVPGLVVGGANPGQQDDCPGYTSSYPGSSYLDTECSYSTNEPAINYTSAVTYLAGGMEAILLGASYTPPYTAPPANVTETTSITAANSSAATVNLFPNPAKDQVTVQFNGAGTSQITVTDMTGRTAINESVSGSGLVDATLNIAQLNKGIYIVTVVTTQSTTTQKLVVQ